MLLAHLTLSSLLSTAFYTILGLLGIGLIIGVHEFGHFFFAKLFNIDVPSFSLGFGPSLLKKKIGDTEFKISAIPLGGYVEIAGMAEVGQGDQKEAARKDDRSFAKKPYYQKLLVLLGGILFNLIFAYIVMIGLFSTKMPKTMLLFPLNSTTSIEAVTPDSAAEKAGLKPGDIITGIDKKNVVNAQELLTILRQTDEANHTLSLQRNGQSLELPVTLDEKKQAAIKGRLGVQFGLKDITSSGIIQAVQDGIKATNQFIKQTWLGFLSICKTRNTEGVGGPIMIISQISQSAQQGFSVWLLLLVLVSINLAVLNLLPLPILDGGQILFYTIEAIIGRPLPESVRLGIHYASWFLILGLILFLSCKDVKSLIFGK